MDKQKALKNAKDFINDIFYSEHNVNINEPFTTMLGKDFFEQDPDLDILKEELHKIGYSISKDPEHKTLWNISKIK